MKDRPVAIIQARTGSTRQPGKVLEKIEDRTLLEYVIDRCKLSKSLADIILATTEFPADDPIFEMGISLGVKVFRGSEEDVLERYVLAAEKFGADLIVRITADCPLIDPEIIDRTIQQYKENPSDYLNISGYPNGLGAVEVLTLSSLQQVMLETSPNDTYYREHVMTYITDHPEKFTVTIPTAPLLLRRPKIRLSVDEQADLDLIKIICHNFAPRINFNTKEIISFLDKNPQYAAINSNVKQKAY